MLYECVCERNRLEKQKESEWKFCAQISNFVPSSTEGHWLFRCRHNVSMCAQEMWPIFGTFLCRDSLRDSLFFKSKSIFTLYTNYWFHFRYNRSNPSIVSPVTYLQCLHPNFNSTRFRFHDIVIKSFPRLHFNKRCSKLWKKKFPLNMRRPKWRLRIKHNNW